MSWSNILLGLVISLLFPIFLHDHHLISGCWTGYSAGPSHTAHVRRYPHSSLDKYFFFPEQTQHDDIIISDACIHCDSCCHFLLGPSHRRVIPSAPSSQEMFEVRWFNPSANEHRQKCSMIRHLLMRKKGTGQRQRNQRNARNA